MDKNNNYIPTIFEVNALSKCNNFSRSFDSSMIYIYFFFSIKWHPFCYKALSGGMRHFLTVLVLSCLNKQGSFLHSCIFPPPLKAACVSAVYKLLRTLVCLRLFLFQQQQQQTLQVKSVSLHMALKILRQNRLENKKELSIWNSLNTTRILSLTLSETTNFRLFQTERVCRRQFRIWWKLQKVLQTGRKHCGKRRNCSLRAISPFPTVFSKDLYCRH